MGMLETLLEERYQKKSAEEPLKGLRVLGWERFSKLGLPTKKTEAFRYLPLTQLYAGNFEAEPASAVNVEKDLILPECENAHLVFVDGVFAPHLSKIPSEIVALPLKEALGTYGNFLQNRWARTLQTEKDPFSALNAAAHGGGLFVYVPPKMTERKTIQCHHILTAPLLAMPRIHVFVGARSEIDWIATLQETSAHAYLMNSALDVALEDGAIFRGVQLFEKVNKDAWLFESMRGTLKTGSRLESVSMTTGAKSLRQDYHVSMHGEGAEALLHGLWMLSNNSQAHTHVVMEHAAPHCRSMQLFKGVLDDVSQSSFEGKIYVHPEAQKTEAYQLNKHLLLGERTLANSKPNLEIFADDVKASHGATVTQVDKDQLFYLRARGMPEKLAKGLLVRGFCHEIADKIGNDCVREKMHAFVEKVMS